MAYSASKGTGPGYVNEIVIDVAGANPVTDHEKKP